MPTPKTFFRQNPFPAVPCAERYMALGSIEAARERLMRSIDRAEGAGLLIGPPGSGKSLLCVLIAEAYRNTFDVVLLAETRLSTRRALLQHLLFHLGLPYREQTEGELRLRLIDHLTRGRSGAAEGHSIDGGSQPQRVASSSGRDGLLLIIDEAQTLPGRLLEEVRMITNIVRDGRPRVQTLLAGGPALDERFAHPRMEAFSQRIAARCYLHPLRQEETARYVTDSLRAAGADPSTLLDPAALAAIHYASDGIPRLINQLMGHTLAWIERESLSRIDAAVIDCAWADLQQLPCPIIGPTPGDRPAASIVEFGELDEVPAEGAAPAAAARPTATAEDEDFWDAATLSAGEAPLEASEPVDGPAMPLQILVPGPSSAPAAPVSDASAGEGDAVQEVYAWDLPTAVPGDLFGLGFEEEESLEVGAAPRGPSPPAVAAVLAEEASDLVEEAAEVDAVQGESAVGEAVEQSLYREILAMNSDAERRGGGHTADERSAAVRLDGGWSAFLSTGPGFESQDDIVLEDDSDLLVIEDAVDVQPIPSALSRRGREVARPLKADEVDFKALFSRMREG